MRTVEIISDRVRISWDSYNADVVVDGKIIQQFRDDELSYQRAHILAMDTVTKHIYLD